MHYFKRNNSATYQFSSSLTWKKYSQDVLQNAAARLPLLARNCTAIKFAKWSYWSGQGAEMWSVLFSRNFLFSSWRRHLYVTCIGWQVIQHTFIYLYQMSVIIVSSLSWQWSASCSVQGCIAGGCKRWRSRLVYTSAGFTLVIVSCSGSVGSESKRVKLVLQLCLWNLRYYEKLDFMKRFTMNSQCISDVTSSTYSNCKSSSFKCVII